MRKNTAVVAVTSMIVDIMLLDAMMVVVVHQSIMAVHMEVHRLRGLHQYMSLGGDIETALYWCMY